MKGIIVFISCILLVFFVLEKSGTFLVVSYTSKEGPITVQKTRWEWHSEKLTPYLKGLSKKWLSHFLRKGTSSSETKLTTKTKKKVAKPSYRLVLKNGTVLSGDVVQKDERGILFQTEGGEVLFHQSEISSLEKE